MIRLAAFLGNPGREYAGNRHNAGFLVADRLPWPLRWQAKYQGLYAAAENAGETVHLLKPQTFMNLSGDAVHAAASFYKIAPPDILVVHDELELPLGTVSLKFSGGLGGHNGLRSIKGRFNSPDFWRLRIGIGRPDHRDIAGWVLSEFGPHEAALADRSLDAACRLLLQVLAKNPQDCLPEWAKKIV